MELHNCPRCSNAFYTAVYSSATLKCPFCSFEIKAVGPEKRTDMRARVVKSCSISAEKESIQARVVDISEHGVGILADGDIPSTSDGTLRVVVKDFDLETTARVVWKTRFGEGSARAGLKFIEGDLASPA